MAEIRAKQLIPMASVADVRRSARFYEHLGFKIDNTFTPPGSTDLSWAWLDSGHAQLMLSRATAPVIPEQQGVLFYLYVDDVPTTHVALTAAGISPGPIEERFYAPQGEFRVTDPDGYTLIIIHV